MAPSEFSFKLRNVYDLNVAIVDPEQYFGVSLYPQNTADNTRLFFPTNTPAFIRIATFFRYFKFTYAKVKFIPSVNTTGANSWVDYTEACSVYSRTTTPNPSTIGSA